MRAFPRVPKLPLPDIRSLLEPSRYLSDSDGGDDEFDDPSLMRCSDDLQLRQTQPAAKRTRCCLTERSDRDAPEFEDVPDVTPQRILSTKVRLALSEKADKGVPRCPDTPARTPLRRSFRGQLRPLVKTPEASEGEMSLAMIDIVERLGEGSYGVVYKARYKADGNLYALKIMKEGYVSMPADAGGVTRLKFDGSRSSSVGASDDTSPVDPDHFYRALTLKDSPPARAPATSLLLPVSSSQSPPLHLDSPQSRAPATSLLVIPPQAPPTLTPQKLALEEPEPIMPKPIPFSLDDNDDAGVGDGDAADVVDIDVDPDEKDGLPLSPVEFPRRVGSFPVKRKQICEAEHQSAISSHPNIVAIKAFWEESDGHFCILSELCGSSLSTIISKNIDGFDEKTVAGFARDLLSALAHIHKHEVIHLDIKPANILISLDGSCLKITDFGQAYKIGSKEKPEEGDGRYMAPELLKDIYSTAADIFSLGMTLYELCTPGLVVPVQGERWAALRQGKIDFRTWRYSDGLKGLIREMLTPDYHERPSAAKLLASEYFQTILCDSPENPFADRSSVQSAPANPR